MGSPDRWGRLAVGRFFLVGEHGRGAAAGPPRPSCPAPTEPAGVAAWVSRREFGCARGSIWHSVANPLTPVSRQRPNLRHSAMVGPGRTPASFRRRGPEGDQLLASAATTALQRRCRVTLRPGEVGGPVIHAAQPFGWPTGHKGSCSFGDLQVQWMRVGSARGPLRPSVCSSVMALKSICTTDRRWGMVQPCHACSRSSNSASLNG